MKYQYRRTQSRRALVSMLLIGLVVGGVAMSLFFIELYQQETVAIQTNLNNSEAGETFSRVQINLVAVDQDGNGVSTPLVVEMEPGTGQTLANIDKLLFWTDTQESIQTAKAVAQSITGIVPSNYDITYSIESEASVIGGPSAGAALTIATMAALQNDSLREDIVITGTVNPDGTIGQIGGVLEKAQAAKDVGASILLVPVGQGEQITLIPQETCERRGNMQICRTTYTEQTINIGRDVGITVVEVSNVSQAYGYFTSDTI